MNYANQGILLLASRHDVGTENKRKHVAKGHFKYETDSDVSDTSISSGFMTDVESFHPGRHNASKIPETHISVKQIHSTELLDCDIEILATHKQHMIASGALTLALDRVYRTINKMSSEDYKKAYETLKEAIWFEGAKGETVAGRLFGKDEDDQGALLQHPSRFGSINIYDFCPKTGSLDKLCESTDRSCEHAIIHVKGDEKFDALGLNAASNLHSEGIKDVRICNNYCYNDQNYRSVDDYYHESDRDHNEEDIVEHQHPHKEYQYTSRQEWIPWLIVLIIVILFMCVVFYYYYTGSLNNWDVYRNNWDVYKKRWLNM